MKQVVGEKVRSFPRHAPKAETLHHTINSFKCIQFCVCLQHAKQMVDDWFLAHSEAVAVGYFEKAKRAQANLPK